MLLAAWGRGREAASFQLTLKEPSELVLSRRRWLLRASRSAACAGVPQGIEWKVGLPGLDRGKDGPGLGVEAFRPSDFRRLTLLFPEEFPQNTT